MKCKISVCIFLGELGDSMLPSNPPAAGLLEADDPPPNPALNSHISNLFVNPIRYRWVSSLIRTYAKRKVADLGTDDLPGRC